MDNVTLKDVLDAAKQTMVPGRFTPEQRATIQDGVKDCIWKQLAATLKAEAEGR